MRRGCGCGCAVALLVLLIATGSSAVLVGHWAALAAPDVAAAPPAAADIPADYLVDYQQAAAGFGLDWRLLAAVGKVASDHGRRPTGCAPTRSGARGPLQFLAGTFATAAKLAGIAEPDICDPADAIPAAAAFLRSNGAPDDWQRALASYHPVAGYPALVLDWAQRYGYGAQLVWPLDGPISQAFGPSALALEPARCAAGYCYAHFHTGIDIAAPLGTPVRAMTAGQVTVAGRLADGAVVVEIEHRPDLFSLYGHLQPQLAVRVGASVAAGQVVGRVGLTGVSTGPHLHFEIDASGVPIDPLLVLPARP